MEICALLVGCSWDDYKVLWVFLKKKKKKRSQGPMQYQLIPAGDSINFTVCLDSMLLQVHYTEYIFPKQAFCRSLNQKYSCLSIINCLSSAASTFIKATCTSSGWTVFLIWGFWACHGRLKGLITFVLSSTTRRPSADTHNTARTAFFPACKQNTTGASWSQKQGKLLQSLHSTRKITSLCTIPWYLFVKNG